jgi:hypothetical protein
VFGRVVLHGYLAKCMGIDSEQYKLENCDGQAMLSEYMLIILLKVYLLM